MENTPDSASGSSWERQTPEDGGGTSSSSETRATPPRKPEPRRLFHSAASVDKTPSPRTEARWLEYGSPMEPPDPNDSPETKKFKRWYAKKMSAASQTSAAVNISDEEVMSPPQAACLL